MLMLSLVALSLLLSAFFSGTESGFYFIKKERLKFLEAQGSKVGSRLLELMRHPGALLSTLLIGNNLALQMGTDSMMRQVTEWGWGGGWLTPEMVTTLVLFFPFFIFGEVLPKATYRLYAEELLTRTVPLIDLCRYLFWPIAFVVGKVAHLLKTSLGAVDEEEFSFDRNNLSVNLGEAYAGGVFSEEQMDSIGQVMNSGDQPVERMMTSLVQCPMISIDSSREEITALYEEVPYTAYPIYAQKKTKVMGWVDMRRLSKAEYSQTHLLDCMEKPVTVEWGTPFHDAIKLFFEKEVPVIFVKNDGKVVGIIFWVDALLKLLR